MKILKRISAAALIAVMALTAVACHPKDEVAVTIGDIEFTSAYYMCALINADSEAKSKVSEDADTTDSSEEIDYYSKKIEDKEFVDWVKDTAIENLKEIAAYKLLCKEGKVEIPEDEVKNAEALAEMYWLNYGYSAYFEPNGVGKNTYKKYLTDSYYAQVYFDSLYGKDGKEAIADETVKTKIYDNFLIADILEVSTSGKTDQEKADLKAKLAGYESDLKSGKKTFEQIYKEQNPSSDENTTETESDDPKPKDEYASILGNKDTAYESDRYDTAKAMAVGEVKLITTDDLLTIIVKQDIKADPYYLDTLDSTARHLIKDDEFDKKIDDYIKKLEPEINDYAVNQFKVKKIKEPEMS